MPYLPDDNPVVSIFFDDFGRRPAFHAEQNGPPALPHDCFSDRTRKAAATANNRKRPAIRRHVSHGSCSRSSFATTCVVPAAGPWPHQRAFSAGANECNDLTNQRI